MAKVLNSTSVSARRAKAISLIKAGVVHELVALEDDTLAHCIHAMRDGERVEDIVGNMTV